MDEARLRVLVREEVLKALGSTCLSPKVLLSFREAARRLGVDRCKVLPLLVASGQLRTVRAGRRVKIPAAEIERVAREGFDPEQSRPRRRRLEPRSPDPAAAILRLKF